MKRIFSMLTAALMLAGTAIWSGCSQNEEIDNTPVVNTGQAGSFTFSLKNNGAATRATQDAENYESEVKTMYVVFFVQNDGQDNTLSKLHRVFFYDEKGGGVASDWGVTKEIFAKMQITEADGEYTIDNPGYTGNYLAYFIANPGSEIITKLQGYQTAPANITLGKLEEELIAEGNADGGKEEDSRGFTMVSGKELVSIGDGAKKQQITLTRLAARFDFTNSAPTLAKINSVQFCNEAAKSYVVSRADIPADATQTDAAKLWKDGATSKTVYVYENLNVENSGNTDYTYIQVKYKLKEKAEDADFGAAEKTLNIKLKEKDTNLAVLRNHFYKIYLNCITGTYTLEVKDWEGGETVTIPNKDLAITYTADSLGKIGDYVYNDNGKLAFSDGGLRKMYLDGSLEWDWDQNQTATRPRPVDNKGTCIGMIFSNNTSENDKKLGFKRGYIVALKDAAKSKSWINQKEFKIEQTTRVSTLSGAFKDLDGLAHCREIEKADPGFANHPALQSILEFEDIVIRPKETSEWYMPSIGQIIALCSNMMDPGIQKYKTNNSTLVDSNTLSIIQGNPSAFEKMVDHMWSGLDEGDYDSFYNWWIYSSTEREASRVIAWYWGGINNDKMGYTNNPNNKFIDNDIWHRVRAVIAF